MLGISTLVACGDGGESGSPCYERMRDAAKIDEMQDTVEDFYPALRECSGLDEWTTAAGETDALEGADPVVFAYTACTSGGPETSVTCVEAIEADPYGIEALED